MKQQYDPQVAYEAVLERVKKDKRLAGMDEKWLADTLLAAFREEAAYVNGLGEDSFYDEDDAYEAVTDALIDADPDREMDIAEVVDAFFDEWIGYMDENGLIDWD